MFDTVRTGVDRRQGVTAAVVATLAGVAWVFLLSGPLEAAVPALRTVPLAGEGLTVADHAGMVLVFGAVLVYLLDDPV